MKVCNDTLSLISKLIEDVDGADSCRLFPSEGREITGKPQDCDIHGVDTEWVDQHGPGMAGDDFWGTVTWVLGDYHLVVHFAT